MSRLLQRFLRYVTVDTTANPHTDAYPSSPGQWELGRIVCDELREAGLVDVRQDEHALVYGALKSNVKHAVPVIALSAHFDTSPETTGANIRPHVIRNYAGGDIPLPGDPRQVIREADNPELVPLRGKTIITTDGTTLLGGDDKAGLAVIVEALARLRERHDKHGEIRALFTCDEEIGRGVHHVDVPALGAAAAYTLDGSGVDTIDVETFSADLATIVIHGVNIHPSIGKGRMVNAVRAAGVFLTQLPADRLAPEATDEREGFLHPYGIEGGVAEAKLRVLLRDFDTRRLAELADLLRGAARTTERLCPGVKVDVNISSQYRNMADGLAKNPHIVAYAEEAFRRLGRTPQRTIIRGGTDGSQLTTAGLPTPNLSTGEHNPHSPLEWVCLEELEIAVDVVMELCRVWAEKSSER